MTIYIILIFLFFSDNIMAAGINLSLENAIQLAREHSFNIMAGRHDSAAAALDFRAAQALRYPTITLNAMSYYIDEVQKLQLSLINKEIGSNDNYQADAKLTQVLFAGGKISNQIGIQKENASAKRFQLSAEILNAAYLTRRAYLSLLIAEAQVRSANASLERVGLIQKDIKNLHHAGLADSVDLLDAESAYLKAEQLVSEKNTLKTNAIFQLKQLTGLADSTEIIPIGKLPEPEMASIKYDSATLNRPELKMAESRIGASRFLVGLSEASYFPSLSGYVGYSAGKPNKDLFNNTWNDYFSGGLVLNWEFNLGGKTKNNKLSAQQSLYSAQMAQKKLQETLSLQAAIAGENLGHAFLTYKNAQSEFEIASNKFRLAKEKQNAGRISVNRLLELEAELTSTEQMHRAAMISFYLYETEYFYAIGSDKIYGGL
jgi:outer membrane protein TolC